MKKAISCAAAAFLILFAVVYFNNPPGYGARASKHEQHDLQSIIDYHKKKAVEHLAILRAGSSITPVNDLMALIGDLEQSGQTPEDIGMERGELKELRIAAFKQQAMEQLARLCEDGRTVEQKIAPFLLFKSYLERGGLDYEDIGKTEADVKSLVYGDCRKA